MATSDRPVTATVQLTYLAQGFDWSANYVARMNPDDDGRMGLFAWLTIANGGAQSFRDARLQVVAGRPNKEEAASQPVPSRAVLKLRCWPMDITSTHPRSVFTRLPWPEGEGEEMMFENADNIVVTARRRERRILNEPMAVPVAPAPAAMMAEQEELGDLKLYRVPERVTVAAQAQKQVAMIDRPDAAFDRVYSAGADSGSGDYRPMPFLLRGRNSKAKGLGLPLPAGGVAIFEEVAGEPMLVGETDLADLAVDEQVELPIGESPDVQWRLTKVRETRRRQDWLAEFTNARAVPVQAEIIVPFDLVDRPPGTERRRGGWALPVTIAANGTASLHYSIRLDRGR